MLGTLGKGFNDNRYITIIYLVLPVIGLLERYGLQQRARTLIGGWRRHRRPAADRLSRVSPGFAALGLTSVGGHAQMVRPLVSPMAEAAAKKQAELDDAMATEIKAMAAATDNIALFFGEDIFLAIASILLIQATLQSYRHRADARSSCRYGRSRAAVAALLIHAARLLLLDRKLGRARRNDRPSTGSTFWLARCSRRLR